MAISFEAGELIFTGIWILVRLFVWIKNRRVDWKREALLLLMYVNLAVIIRITFFPRALVDGRVQPLVFDAASAYPFRINLIPFVRLGDYRYKSDLMRNVIGNVGLFIPTGIILPIIYKKLNSFGKVIGAGALISLGIEILQLPFSVRASDVDDLIMNTAGVAVGYGIYAVARALKRRHAARKQAAV